jgi:hypothetical protein
MTTARWKSVLTGALVAAALTLPAAADNWFSGPTKTFSTKNVSVRDIVGNVSIAVRDGGPATVQISGDKQRVDETFVRQEGDTMQVVGHAYNDVWDWHHWFDFSEHSHGALQVKISMPRGGDVQVDGLVGDAQIGDTMGSMHFEAVATNSTIGRVSDAKISLAGSGNVKIASVQGDLNAETAGDGKIMAGNVGAVRADVAGSGAVELGNINGDLHLDIAGSGDFSAKRLNGGAHIDIAGSGSVHIDDGQADPFHVDILGSGDVRFGGVAVDPHISGFGSGQVKLHAIKGKLSSDGMANVKVGD